MWMPSSARLRYSMYWMIVLVSLNLFLAVHFSRLGKLSSRFSEQGLGLTAGLTLLIVVISTDGAYVRPHFYTLATHIENNIDQDILRMAQEKSSFCFPEQIRPHIFLYISKFHPPAYYSVKICE